MNLDHLTVFAAVAESQSFTAAGQRLGLDKSRVSRVVSALEHSLGSALLVRTTRSVRLTPEGEALARRVTPLLAELQQATRAVPSKGAIASGGVTVTTTADLARAVLAPVLARLRQRYPAVTVRVLVTQELVDLPRHGVDLALRVGRPGPGTFVARKVGELEAGFFAAPSYLERRGTPKSMAELREHDGLWPTPPKGQRAFSSQGLGVDPSPPAVSCVDFGVLAAIACAGGGIALLPTFLARDEVAKGALLPVLPQVKLGQAPLYLVSPPGRPVPARVAAVRGVILEAFAPR
jgi:DNA-binding transcriptional LysR family regulator